MGGTPMSRKTFSSSMRTLHLIDQERRGILKERTQRSHHLSRETCFLQRLLHQFDPPISRRLIDVKSHVSHAQSRMPALLGVGVRSAKALDEKPTQPRLGGGHVAFG